MLATIPVLLIVAYTMSNAVNYKNSYDNYVSNQNSFDRIVSSADYLVEYGLAVRSKEGYYPNWIMNIDQETIKKTKENSGLKNFAVEFDNPPLDNSTCIYRIVVYGSEKEIRKIYFCGE